MNWRLLKLDMTDNSRKNSGKRGNGHGRKEKTRHTLLPGLRQVM